MKKEERYFNFLLLGENMNCKSVGWIAMALTIIGALNWGLWGFFQFDLVAWLFKGNTTVMSRIVYSVVGLAGLISLKHLFGCCSKKQCPCDCSCCKGNGSGKSGCCK
jgi:uncharacterized membrane protein YuzA (DUF378 family)